LEVRDERRKSVERFSYGREHRDKLVPKALDVLRGQSIPFYENERHRILDALCGTLDDGTEPRPPAPKNRIEVPQLRLGERVVPEVRVELAGWRMGPDVGALPPLSGPSVFFQTDGLEHDRRDARHLRRLRMGLHDVAVHEVERPSFDQVLSKYRGRRPR